MSTARTGGTGPNAQATGQRGPAGVASPGARARWRAPLPVERSAAAGAAAALATLAASTSLAAVVSGLGWLLPVASALTLVAGTGIVLRRLGWAPILVALGQCTVLLAGVTAVFSEHGIAAVIPGPAAVAELTHLLASAGDQIQTGVPPVAASEPITLLMTVSIGLVGLVVDTVAIAAAAPAASGLALLSVYAVPASLSASLLPWWSFAAGAAAYALLIAVHGQHRRWDRYRGRRGPARVLAAPVPAALIALAITGGLIAGTSVTGVGTTGALPEPSQTSGAGTGVGLSPFTSLEGMLNEDNERELFRVRGLADDPRLMRAFTLDTFHANEGWTLAERDALPGGEPAAESLADTAAARDSETQAGAAGAGSGQPGELQQVRVEPRSWQDLWLPVFGNPLGIDGIDERWLYDQHSGAVFAQQRQQPPEYTVTAELPDPQAGDLRGAGSGTDAPASVYTELPEIDPRVAELSEEITADAQTRFDKAESLWRFFTQGDRFTYDTQTAAGTDDDALVDFLFHGRTGFCEQFASSMAVMLRTQDIPARVAVGFTAGDVRAGYRSVTSRDAHAWVEVYFDETHEWVPFDPTPLDDGRGTVPSHLDGAEGAAADTPDGGAAEEPPGEQEQSGPTDEPAGSDAGPGADDRTVGGVISAGAPAGWWWLMAAAGALAFALSAASVSVSRRTARVRLGSAGLGSAGLQRLSWLHPWLAPGAALGWLAAAGLAVWPVSGWAALGAPLLGGLILAPWLLRDGRRKQRLHLVATDARAAIPAAWRELLDECADRGMEVSPSGTVRETVTRLAEHVGLDTSAERSAVDAVVEGLELSWYGPGLAPEGGIAASVEEFRLRLHQRRPLSLAERALPRSVLAGRFAGGAQEQQRSPAVAS